MEPIITEIVGLVLKGSTMELGKRFTEGAIAKIGTLRQFIITRLQGKPKVRRMRYANKVCIVATTYG